MADRLQIGHARTRMHQAADEADRLEAKVDRISISGRFTPAWDAVYGQYTAAIRHCVQAQDAFFNLGGTLPPATTAENRRPAWRG